MKLNPPPKPAYCIGLTEGCGTAENVVNLGCTKGISHRGASQRDAEAGRESVQDTERGWEETKDNASESERRRDREPVQDAR